MIMRNGLDRFFIGRPHVAGIVYATAVVGFFFIAVWALSDLFERYSMHNERADLLGKLQERARSLAKGSDAQGWPPGSPFLEGQTETIASAALLQRITNAVTDAGGNILSSEVDRSGSRDEKGYQRVTTTCDIDELGLQRLLYDLEANMPFLFVELLMVQNRARDSGRLQVQVRVAGRWGGAS